MTAKEKVINVFRSNPVKFTEVICKYKLTDYQKKFILDRSKRKLFVSGRQVGKSTCSALEALWFAFCFENKEVMVIAPSERQARIIYDKIYSIVRWNTLLSKDCEKLTMGEIKFLNGSVIRVVPVGVDASTARGFSVDMLIVDEAQLVPDAVFSAMMPSLAVKDGTLILLGTPAGRDGFFFKAWISDGWSKHVVRSDQSPFISQSFINEYKMLYGEEMFRRELMAEFLDIGDLFFDMNKVHSLAKLDVRMRPLPNEVYYAGMDLATVGGDENVLVFLTEKGERLEVRGVFHLAKRDASYVCDWAREKVEKWKPLRLIVDETGLGEGLVAMLREKLGGSVSGFKFSSKMRYELYLNLKRLIDDEKILLPNDMNWINQFATFRYSKRSDGKLTVKKAGKRDDFVDALALACWGAEKGVAFDFLALEVDSLWKGF